MTLYKTTVVLNLHLVVNNSRETTIKKIKSETNHLQLDRGLITIITKKRIQDKWSKSL